jgi:hypothetical protein
VKSPFKYLAFSNNETESAFFINTQFKKILFIPSSIGFSPLDIQKYTNMAFVEKKEKNSRKLQLLIAEMSTKK